MYSGGGNNDGNRGVRGGGVGNDDCWAKSTNSVLDLVSNLYSDSNIT